MNFLDRIVVFLRSKYDSYGVKIMYASFAVFSVLCVSCALVDKFIPVTLWWNLLRTAVAVPTALSFFAGAYFFGLGNHYEKMSDEVEWTPFRERLSYAWRLRVGVIIAVAGYLPVYATTFTPMMTLVSALYFSLLVALALYVRPTKREKEMQKHGIPDVRDVKFSRNFRTKTEEREARNKEKKKDRKFPKIFG